MVVADAYSAMCIDRPYRKGLSWTEIRNEFIRGAGTQFDPEIAVLFVQAIDELRVSGDGMDVLIPALDPAPELPFLSEEDQSIASSSSLERSNGN
jgi:hypothetical protein